MQQATTIRRAPLRTLFSEVAVVGTSSLYRLSSVETPPFVVRRQNILVVKTLVCSLVELSRRVASCKLILTVCLS